MCEPRLASKQEKNETKHWQVSIETPIGAERTLAGRLQRNVVSLVEPCMDYSQPMPLNMIHLYSDVMFAK